MATYSRRCLQITLNLPLSTISRLSNPRRLAAVSSAGGLGEAVPDCFIEHEPLDGVTGRKSRWMFVDPLAFSTYE